MSEATNPNLLIIGIGVTALAAMGVGMAWLKARPPMEGLRALRGEVDLDDLLEQHSGFGEWGDSGDDTSTAPQRKSSWWDVLSASERKRLLKLYQGDESRARAAAQRWWGG